MDSPSDEAEELNTEDQQNEDSSTSDQDLENTDESSTSEQSEDDPSTFDVVMDAIKPEGEDKDEAEGNSEEDASEDKEEKPEEGDSDEDEDNSDDDEFTEEELKALKQKTRKRFEKLQTRYREMSEELETVKEQIPQLEAKAGYYEQFTGFLEQNRISQDEANELFNIGALMKNDPVRALELIAPHYNNLLQITGNILPPDLKQQVDQGYMTKEHALELSRLRATGQTQKVIDQERQTHQTQQETRRQNEQIQSIQTALADWETNWKASDPDYNLKKDRVLERVELKLVKAQKEGKLPSTVEEAVNLIEDVKKSVEKEISRFRPKPKKVDSVDGGGSTGNSAPEPKDTKDVIRRTLGT